MDRDALRGCERVNAGPWRVDVDGDPISAAEPTVLAGWRLALGEDRGDSFGDGVQRLGREVEGGLRSSPLLIVVGRDAEQPELLRGAVVPRIRGSIRDIRDIGLFKLFCGFSIRDTGGSCRACEGAESGWLEPLSCLSRLEAGGTEM